MNPDRDHANFGKVVMCLLEDGTHQRRPAGHILADIIAAAMTRPTISEGLHAAIIEAAQKRSEER